MDLSKATVLSVGTAQQIVEVEITDGKERGFVNMNVGEVLNHLLQRLRAVEEFMTRNDHLFWEKE